MIGKGKKSKYLLTKLFSMDYFHYYSTPLIFATYFFPFMAYTKNRAYLQDEIDEKMNNIRENKHGIFYNYATQGFGNTPFYEPDISFAYFYDKLTEYDKIKNRYFDVDENNCAFLESDANKKDLQYILSCEQLLLKRGFVVPENVKKAMLFELNTSNDVKVVLASLLYYIVSPEHRLPNISKEFFTRLSDKLEFQFNFHTNIIMDFRKNLDDCIYGLSNRIQKATYISVCCLSGIRLFGNSEVSTTIQDNIIDSLKKSIIKNNLVFEIIISDCNSNAFQDATKFQTNISHLRCNKNVLSSISLVKLLELKKSVNSSGIAVKLTKFPLPYALFIMKFKDETLDYLKVDIYSPLVNDNDERPCFYVFKNTNPLLFRHFDETFKKMWKDDDFSKFAENEVSFL